MGKSGIITNILGTFNVNGAPLFTGPSFSSEESNTSYGYQALTNITTGIENTAYGYQSLRKNITGSKNVAIGKDSLYNSSTGANNTGIGYQSLYNVSLGSYNTGIGFQSLNNVTGNYNIGMGYLAGPLTANSGVNNTIAIGMNVAPTKSKQILIGNAADYDELDIIVSRSVGINTTSPNSLCKLEVNGLTNMSTLFSPKIDTFLATDSMFIGNTSASSITIGNSNITTTINGTVTATNISGSNITTKIIETPDNTIINIGTRSTTNGVIIGRNTQSTTLNGTVTFGTAPSLPTGTTAVTQDYLDNTTAVATTAFVRAQQFAPLASPTFTGTPSLPTGTTAVTQNYLDNTRAVATTAFVRAQSFAPLASPTFTGTVTAPTIDSSTTITIGGTNATSLTLGRSSLATATTTIYNATLTPRVDTISAGSLTIGNTTASSISIGGGTATTTIYNATLTPRVDTNTAGQLTIGNTTASSISIGGGTATTTIYNATLTPRVDTISAESLTIGNTTATSINIGSTSANVGINTASPAYKLDIAGTLRATGAVTGASFSATSDYRIKENVTSLSNTSYGNKIDQLNPVYYFNKTTNTHDFGFIAHEVKDVYPDLVIGNKDETEYQRLNYIGLVPLCIHEIKILRKEIEMLKKQLLN
jgi:hypothetical protein